MSFEEQQQPPQPAVSSETSAFELAAAQRLGRIGSWHWDSVNDQATWSLELYRIFGLDPARPPPSFAKHPKLYTPESWEVLQLAVERALAGGEPYCVELAYFRHGGTGGGWMEARGESIRDAAGTVVALRGTAQEISDRRQAQEAGALAQARRDRALMLRTFSQSIRTSLNSVFGFAHLLKGAVDKGAPENRALEHGGTQERWVDRILAASQQIVAVLQEMETLDGRLFDAAAAEAGGSAATGAERLETLLALIPCPILIHDLGGKVVHVSQVLLDDTGYTREQLPTRAAWAALAYVNEDAAAIAGGLAEAKATRTVSDVGERWVTTRSGRKLRWHLFAVPTASYAGGEPLVVSIGIDVTARHEPQPEPEPG